MRYILNHTIIILITLLAVASCSPGKNFTTRYYNENRLKLDSLRNKFNTAYTKKPFHIEFKDRNFRHISYEILSDTFRYIYNFDLEESDLADTLEKYHYQAGEIISLIADMQTLRCTWISNLEYYENQQKKSLVFVSVRHSQLESFMKGEKYYALAFFNERQLFDLQGRLTDKSEKKKRYREINGQVFHRITDRVCYAITGNFR